VALIAALASDVELLLLDEPTAGLDPLMDATFREIIRSERSNGRTVLLASHILAEVEALADTISIIRDGRAVESGSLADLRHLTRTSVDVATDSSPAVLAGTAGIHDLVIDDHRARFEVDGEALADVMRRLAGLGVRSLTSHPPTLEELFMRHYRDTG
jgi:ABC-2 type transport system ATP-binding protein